LCFWKNARGKWATEREQFVTQKNYPKGPAEKRALGPPSRTGPKELAHGGNRKRATQGTQIGLKARGQKKQGIGTSFAKPKKKTRDQKRAAKEEVT